MSKVLTSALTSALAVACGLLLTSGVAAAAPVGTFTCASGQASISANVSFYSLGITNPSNIGSSTGGVGPGKAILQPLILHASLQNFQQFFALASSATVQPLCTLTSTFGDGMRVQYVFRDMIAQSVQATATAAAPNGDHDSDQHGVRYVEVQLAYAAIEVKTSGGSDDGGLSGTVKSSGWNVVPNSSTGN